MSRGAAAVGRVHRLGPGVAGGDVAVLEVLAVACDLGGEAVRTPSCGARRRAAARRRTGAEVLGLELGGLALHPRSSCPMAAISARRSRGRSTSIVSPSPVAQGEEKPLTGERALLDVDKFHAHDHLPQVDQTARGEVQRPTVAERVFATWCSQDRMPAQGMDPFVGPRWGRMSSSASMAGTGPMRKRSRAAAAASSSSAARAAAVAASRSAGPSSVDPSAWWTDRSRFRSDEMHGRTIGRARAEPASGDVRMRLLSGPSVSGRDGA